MGLQESTLIPGIFPPPFFPFILQDALESFDERLPMLQILLKGRKKRTIARAPCA